METHAHHLHKTPGQGWKHYLFEFLMLFLAVTLGFFVENKREYYADEHRGKQYIKSFVEDLEKDTSNFSILISLYDEKLLVLKNLDNCYDSVTGSLHSSDCLWDITDYTSGFPDLIYTDRTLQQLKNAGGLRLLKEDDADSITAYDNRLRAVEKSETTEMQETQTLLRHVTYQLINFKMIKERMTGKIDIGKNKTPFIYGDNGELVNNFFNVLGFYKHVVRDQIENISELRDKAIITIKYFNAKYHLK
jgi:hypothetical protein